MVKKTTALEAALARQKAKSDRQREQQQAAKAREDAERDKRDWEKARGC